MDYITIKAKPFPKEQLPDVLKQNGICVNAYAERFFAHPAFTTESCPEEEQIVIASLRELGFRDGAVLQEVFDVLPEYRLKPCRINTGLFLRLAWREQEKSRNAVLTGTHRSPDSAVTVLSPVLEEDDSFPKGLYLRNVEGTLWLRGYTCDASYKWSGDDLFAFAR